MTFLEVSMAQRFSPCLSREAKGAHSIRSIGVGDQVQTSSVKDAPASFADDVAHVLLHSALAPLPFPSGNPVVQSGY